MYSDAFLADTRIDADAVNAEKVNKSKSMNRF